MLGSGLRILLVKIRLGETDQISFLQLLIEQETHIRIGILFKHAASPERIHQHRQRRKLVGVTQREQRTKNTRLKIGAAAYWLGKNRVRRVRAQVIDGIDQLRKTAAKAAAGC